MARLEALDDHLEGSKSGSKEGGVGGGGGGWGVDQETMFPQLAKRSPCLYGQRIIAAFFHGKY